MKKQFFALFFGALTMGLNAQESLISDIMNVDAVAPASTEDFQKAEEEYTKVMDKEKATLEKALEKLSADYKKDVEAIIKDFTKVLEGGIEKDVNNQKGIVQTAVNTSTINLRRDKKLAVNTFAVAIQKAIRDLPKELQQTKEKELETTKGEYLASFDQEFNANQSSLRSFMAKQHVTDPGQ